MCRWGVGLTALMIFMASTDACAQRLFADGFEDLCLLDSDADRLADCDEIARETSRYEADTDGDGLFDGDEVLGTTGGLDLPAFGVDPRHKDLLVEMDWDDDSRGCFSHSHRPPAAAIAEVKLFYAAIPLANPDGQPGINFIADFGQGGVFSGGNLVDFPNAVTSKFDQPFFDAKAGNFASNRVGYFRYQAHAHFWENNNPSSGIGNIVGDNSVVSLNCSYNSPDHVRNTIIHELGHNLALRHGGDVDCNRKPNYNSIMNYNHQFYGIDVDCDRYGDGIDALGYSDGTRTAMVQGQLDEAQGLCPLNHPQHKPIDWNANGVIDPGLVSFNGLWSEGCVLTTSSDHDDYAALTLPPSSPTDGGAPGPIDDSGACAPVPQP